MIINSLMRLLQAVGRLDTGDSQEKERRVWLYQLVQSQLCSRHSEDDEEQKYREFAGGKSGELRAGLQAVLDPRR